MHTHNRGFTLLELMLVLAGIATMTAGGFYVAKRNTAQAKTQTAVQTARTLSNVLAQSWGQSGSFAGIDSSAVAQQAPGVATVKHGKLFNGWGGPIDFAPTPDATAYAMTFGGVPSDACVSMSTQLARQFASVAVNNTPLASSDPVSASKLCGASDRNAVTLTSFPVAPHDDGEVPMPADHGAPPKFAPPPPMTKGAHSVGAVTPVASLAPVTLAMPHALNNPTVSMVSAGGVSAGPVTPSGSPGTALPPGVALPPQTCFPSVTSTPVVSTVSNTQTLACQAGYAGVITQREDAQQTVTTTKTVTCATRWSPPLTTTKQTTDTGTYGPWTTIGNTCAPMCSTQLASYPAQSNYQWVTVNQGCPAGYTGTKSYQVLQVQTRSASCANPSGTGAPAYGAWSGWSNTGTTQNAIDTCALADPVPAVPAVLSSMWGGNVVLQQQSGVSSYQMGLSCYPSNPTVPVTSAPVPSTVQTLPVSESQSGVANWPGVDIWVPTGTPYTAFGFWGHNITVPAQFTAMTNALPQSACAYGAWGTAVPVQIWVRACNASGQCSGWSVPKEQFCTWNKC